MNDKEEHPNSKLFGYIYKISHPKLFTKNVKDEVISFSYIGRTEKTVQSRFQQHLRDAKNFKDKDISGDGKLHANMWANGLKNFVCEELDKAYSPEELYEKEKYYLEKYDSINNGWNKISASTITRLSSKILEVMVHGRIIKYDSLAQLCRRLGISNSTVTFWMKEKDLALEEAIGKALEAKKATKIKKDSPIVIYRINYSNFNEAVRDKKLNKHDMNEKSLRARIRKGMSIEEAFSIPPIRPRDKAISVTTPDGTMHVFESLADAHRQLSDLIKIPCYSSVVTNFKQRGLTIEQSFGFNAKPWEEKYIELDKLVTTKGYTYVGTKSPYADPVILHATKEIFTSVKEFSKNFNFDYTTIACEIKDGLTPDQVLIKRKHPSIRDLCTIDLY